MTLELVGTVTAGFGDGSYYVKKYADRIRELVGFSPFLGTLNVRMGSGIPDMKAYVKHRIDGFEKEGEEFYPIELIPAVILSGDSQDDCRIVLPEKTKHRNEIELIAESNLREKLGLKDGDVVRIKINS